MKYLVMECHPGYAVVLDDNGRFWKVANLQYEVGQVVSQVIKLESSPQLPSSSRRRTVFWTLASAAACICLIAFGSWQMLMMPFGFVRLKINPDVQITVNRMDYVIGLEGLNPDGQDLIDQYSYQWKKIGQVSDELADRAVEMGYLSSGGVIHLTVQSDHETWRTATEDQIQTQLEFHTENSITIVVETSPSAWTSPDSSQSTPTQPDSMGDGDSLYEQSSSGDSAYGDSDYGTSSSSQVWEKEEPVWGEDSQKDDLEKDSSYHDSSYEESSSSRPESKDSPYEDKDDREDSSDDEDSDDWDEDD